MSAAWWARAGCLVAVALPLAAVPTANAAALRLDAGFGEGGIARMPIKEMFGVTLLRPVRQPDGKVLVAASSYLDHANSQILLARFTRSGRPDATFGHGGSEHLGYRWNFAPMALQVQPDGRILVLGAAGFGPFFYPSPAQLGLVRLLPDGSRDPTFGTNGFVAWNPPGQDRLDYTYPLVFVPQADRKVLAAAFSTGRGNIFVRFLENGAVDESFGPGGMVEEPNTPGFSYHEWVRLPDGRLVALASRLEAGATPTTWLRRFTADGAVDRGFGQDGAVRVQVGDPSGVLELLPTRHGGLIIISYKSFRRIQPDGQLDPDFGTTCDRPRVRASIAGAAVTRDGGLLATGTRQGPDREHGGRWFTTIVSLVFRYGPDGCAKPRPLRLTDLVPGPPLPDGPRTALVPAIDRDIEGTQRGLALIRIRR